jgi:glycosyltransferase involved in cell wall biosynthesis
MPATVDLLNRLNALGEFSIKAFPLVRTELEVRVNFPCRLPRFRGRYVNLNNLSRSAPESQLLTISAFAANALVKESDAIILMGLQALPALYTTWLARRQSKPIIAVSQTMGPALERNRPWIIRVLKHWLLKRASIHVAQTPSTMETLSAVYGIPQDRFVYAPFEAGVSFIRRMYEQEKRSREDLREELNLSDAVALLFVGSIIRLKAVDVLLDAFAKIRKAGSRVRLLIAGQGPEQSNMIQRARDLGIEESVSFLGKQSPKELVRYYKAADIFVLPTRKDMWPKVLAEAALASLPLVCTDACGASGHLVRNGLNGFVVPVGDADALAHAIQRLLDPDLRKIFGEASRGLVDQYCDPEGETAGFAASIRYALKR